MTSGNALDRAALEELLALGLLKKVCRLHLDLTPDLVVATRTAIETGDFEAAARTCHRMKSSSAYVGAADFSRLCAEMETAACQSDAQGCKTLLPRLLDSHNRTIAALKDLVAEDETAEA